jgi:hypothetical protein
MLLSRHIPLNEKVKNMNSLILFWIAGQRAREPPKPIPNLEVKPRSVPGFSAVFGRAKPGKLAIH